MKIKMMPITIQDLVNGYEDNDEEGVYGFGGRLNIRPPYQRELVYNEQEQKEVMNSVRKGFPLNVMYWMRNEDGTFELLDGQQRTLSICKYYDGDFLVDYDGNPKYFHNLTKEQQDQILHYELTVYVCEGTDQERLDWFRIINIAGKQLTDQELRNAVYTGAWITNAKRYFSKTGCLAYNLGGRYLNGSAIRQEYLETILSWIASRDGIGIEDYMATHQHDKNASAEKKYFEDVIDWIEKVFPVYRGEMKGRPWGLFYNQYKDADLDPLEIEKTIAKLMADEDVTNKKGVYEYILTGKEKCLSIRKFQNRDKRTAYERQKGICPICGKKFDIDEMDADHIKPWSKGGATVLENCQVLCHDCNLKKSAK